MAIGKMLKRLSPMYRGSDKYLKILLELIIARLKDSISDRPEMPKIRIKTNRKGISIRLVVVSPFRPQIMIKKIKVSAR